MEENNIRNINDIMSLKNQSIFEDLVKEKQEKVDKDAHKIMEEFPVEAPKVIQTKTNKQNKPYSIKLNTSKKKFSFFKKKKKPKLIVQPIRQLVAKPIVKPIMQ